MRASSRMWVAAGWAGVLAMGPTGCEQPVPAGSLVVTQRPVSVADVGAVGGMAGAPTVLDERYPPGSRVVLVRSPWRSGEVRVLSRGLWAAGGPVVATDGRQVVFVGKATARSAWQVYEANLGGGVPRMVTSVEGGAMDPAFLKGRGLVFASPVPAPGAGGEGSGRPQLRVKWPHEVGAGQLTFAPGGAADATVLPDGRILFVAARAGTVAGQSAGRGLFTINMDGTEVAGFACQHDDGPGWVGRPRVLGDGRVGFVASSDGRLGTAEAVALARPMRSRAAMAGLPAGRVTSVEPDEAGAVLVCVGRGEGRGGGGVGMAVERWEVEGGAGGVVFDDPGWDEVEAVSMRVRKGPMGRVSTMDSARRTGRLLCLDVNETMERGDGGVVERAARLRAFTWGSAGGEQVLGEVAVQADGSWMAEVPADVPVGFEALDAGGRVLRRQPAMVWVRPGENRSCVGCHEAHHQAPRNVRPLAVSEPPVRMTGVEGERRMAEGGGRP